MRISSAFYFLVICSLTFINTSCNAENDDDKFNALGVKVKFLGRAIEGYLYSNDVPDSTSNDEILQQVVKKEPALAADFNNYSIHINRKQRHADVLVCDKNSEYAIMEDAACTDELDLPLWHSAPPRSCKFSLDLTNICK